MSNWVCDECGDVTETEDTACSCNDVTALDRLHMHSTLRRMQSHHVAVALEQLGRQLVVAAALTRAYRLGGVNAWAVECASVRGTWVPGCQRSAP